MGVKFTAGGQVVFQLERANPDFPPRTLHIFPIGTDGKPGAVPMSIDLGDVNDSTLASVEVGPPDASAGGARLALLVFARRGQAGMEVGAFRLPAQPGDPQPIGDRIPFDSATAVSEIGFDGSGRFAVLSLKSPGNANEPPKARVWVFGVSEANKLQQAEVAIPAPQKDSTKSEEVVNAVTFRGDRLIKAGIESVSLDTLVTGRLNGALYCGGKRLARASKPTPYESPVVALRVVPGSGTFAAQHEAPALIIADCGTETSSPVALDSPSLLRALMLDQSRSNSGKPGRLSYVQDSVLKCVEIPGGSTPEPCPVMRVPVYEAAIKPSR